MEEEECLFILCHHMASVIQAYSVSQAQLVPPSLWFLDHIVLLRLLVLCGERQFQKLIIIWEKKTEGSPLRI